MVKTSPIAGAKVAASVTLIATQCQRAAGDEVLLDGNKFDHFRLPLANHE
jgi:hypothetical protein